VEPTTAHYASQSAYHHPAQARQGKLLTSTAWPFAYGGNKAINQSAGYVLTMKMQYKSA
jgi:hypothetical protein